MPPVSIASVWQAARIANGIAARRANPAHVGPTVPGWTSSSTPIRTTRSAVSGISGRSLNKPTQARDRPSGPANRGGTGAGRHRRVRRIVSRLPTRTTLMRMTPWMAVDRLAVTPSRVRSVGPAAGWRLPRSGRRPAPSASQADAAEDDRRDALQRVRAGERRSRAGAGGDRQPTERAEEARQGVGDDLGPPDRHAAAEGGQPVAPDRVEGEAERRPAEGIQMTATTTIRNRSARGNQSTTRDPLTQALSQSAAPPPGELRTSRARRPTRTTSPG